MPTAKSTRRSSSLVARCRHPGEPEGDAPDLPDRVRCPPKKRRFEPNMRPVTRGGDTRVSIPDVPVALATVPVPAIWDGPSALFDACSGTSPVASLCAPRAVGLTRPRLLCAFKNASAACSLTFRLVVPGVHSGGRCRQVLWRRRVGLSSAGCQVPATVSIDHTGPWWAPNWRLWS
jgi:hypothetical protein